jgi:hypothetical protein
MGTMNRFPIAAAFDGTVWMWLSSSSRWSSSSSSTHSSFIFSTDDRQMTTLGVQSDYRNPNRT